MPTRKKKGFIVAIDGPAGAGKSTVSKLLAEALEGCLLDTGAMYRSVAYFALREGAQDEKRFAEIAKSIKFDIMSGSRKLLVNGEYLGQKLRTQKISQMASYVSKFKYVRESLTRRQRSLGKEWSKKLPVIVEGRDIGTIVFPDVEFKFFVTADPKVRAQRRYLELKRQGTKKVSLKQIIKENTHRDAQDSERKFAPLRCPEDAVVVDTSSMSINQVVHFMVDHVKNRVALLG
jgi:CMP/dCMP kinase